MVKVGPEIKSSGLELGPWGLGTKSFVTRAHQLPIIILFIVPQGTLPLLKGLKGSNVKVALNYLRYAFLLFILARSWYYGQQR
jgi:hypothetical protein